MCVSLRHAAFLAWLDLGNVDVMRVSDPMVQV
jgi:hypothetical protein